MAAIPDSPLIPESAPILLLLGPTASGKSALAMALANRFPIEIVSVDSACVYRGLNIGTAKPDLAEQAQVVHHLIDCVDPWDPYSAARFAADAHQAINSILGRRRIPLLVGGTMLYAKALMHGLDDLPAADPEFRHKIALEAKALGWPALHARLALLDAVTAARLAPQDAQRISRALEIQQLTGRPMSELMSAGNRHQSPPFDWRVLALEPSERRVLHQRIADRFIDMLKQGLIAEVEQLRAERRIHADLPAMRCVGYRQIWAMLEGKIALPQLNERAIVATRQLAKRQLTWLRAMPQRRTIDCTDPNGSAKLIDLASQALADAYPGVS
jgi:tRNA dimethylallyltransferase